jgi:hypothetical protein
MCSTATASVWREGLTLTAGSNAEQLFRYTDDFFGALGYSAATRLTNANGQGRYFFCDHYRYFISSPQPCSGEVVVLAAGIDADALLPLAEYTLKMQKLISADAQPSPGGVETLIRQDNTSKSWVVHINYGSTPVQVGPSKLAAYAVRVASYPEAPTPAPKPPKPQATLKWWEITGGIVLVIGGALLGYVAIRHFRGGVSAVSDSSSFAHLATSEY